MKIVDEEEKQNLQALEENAQSIKSVDKKETSYIGYVPITLSSAGNFGVPQKVWIKNFTTEDALYLSMANETLLPEYLITILNKNIISDTPVNVATWTEKQVIELLIRLYANYFSTIIDDIVFPFNEEDEAFLEKNPKIKERIKNGWKPTTSVELTNINFLKLNAPIKNSIKVKGKQGTFTFSIPRFGDILALNSFIKDKFEEEDKKIDAFSKKENPSLRETDEIKDTVIKKSSYILSLTKCFYLQALDTQDVSNLPLSEKIEKFAEHPAFDAKIFKTFEKAVDSLEYGIDPMIKVKNPLTNEYCTRRFVFRLSNILQIIFISGLDAYDFEYE